jgi:lambda family phage portal protein
LLQISAALGIPYPYLANDMVKGNFSNSRLALIEFRRRVSAWQHSVMVYQLCRPVYARWMDAAVLSGGLTLPDYEANRVRLLTADWLPTKWDWVDPLKDANAEIAQIEAGLKSRTQAIAERGYDAEQVDREIAAERERERLLGLDFRRPGSPAQGVQAVPSSDEDDGEDTQSTDETDDAEDPSRKPEDQP